MLIEDCLDELSKELDTNSKTQYEYEGKKVPRVTEILSKTIASDALLYWANGLGFKHKRYKDELEKAANIGTIAHNEIENFFKNSIIGKSISFKAFMRWYEPIKDKFELIAAEEKLVCKYFGGTFDMLAKIDGKIYLIDFKTSNHVTFKYMLQLAAYRYMLYYTRGINIDGVLILQLSKTSETFTEYVLNLAIQENYIFMENCTRTFLSLVYAYYNTNYIENEYRRFFKC